ncbi:MAG TPA: tRNA (adenosine(37)-N6)-threonylcarbamoyltransferase complex transferase subunit TsaD [Candidatus Paceibacterota bacterium]|nr:tRNA (adenosine(37)-N6)-threonylcarbamoyltransferase complex transferase subunit TsaD [Candidatus Paceibacterota bacterium]
MKILAIETSCDETGIALVEGQKTASGFAFTVLQSALLSQAALHAEYGGVYPNLAKREHEKNLPALYAPFAELEADAIAVTRGPGLEPALWSGIEFAKKVAHERGLPLLPINHLEGHLLSSLVKDGELKEVKLPVLALLISGGHTEFVLMKDWFNYKIVGQTLDDAVGEAFDKVARMLGLPYPGGPHISRLAEEVRTKQNLVSEKVLGSASPQPDHFPQQGSASPKLPRPMIGTNNCDVSFSGLKTAALYALRDMGGIQNLSSEQVANFAREFEDAVADVLVHKTKRALDETGAETFVIGGGVAANKHIRERLVQMVAKKFNEVEVRLPELGITGDNAVMIAEAALGRALAGKKDEVEGEIVAKGNLSISSLT